MRKSIFKSIALVISLGFFATATAQDTQLLSQEGDFTVGGGLGFGTAVGGWAGGEPGIAINGYYGITDEIRGGLCFIYYLVGESDFSSSEINIDGHYLFRNEDGLVLYGLAGISYGTYTWRFGGSRVSAGTTGINLGGGVEYDLGSVLIYGEPKITLAGFGQLNITGGVRMRF